MRLAYYISEYPTRSHTFIRREIAELRQRSVDIKVFSTHKCPKQDLLSDLDLEAYSETWSIHPINKFNVLRAHLWAFTTRPRRYFQTLFSAFKHRLPGLKNGLWAFFYFLEAIYVSREVEKHTLKHIHVHFANPGAFIAKLVAYYLNITWSINLHGACDFEYPCGPLLGEKIETTSFVNCASYYGRSQALRTVSTEHWDKIFVSRCGIELSRMEDPGHIHQLDKDDPIRILCVGRLSPEKGQFGLMEAFTQAYHNNKNLLLLLVGDGPDRTKLEHFAKAKGVSQSVKFVGSVAETAVFDHMKKCDIFVLSSFMEGIPMVLMEAMALRLAVIAPRVAGIPELVFDKENGLLFDPGNWHQLAEKMLFMTANVTLREQYAEAARKRVTEEFAIRKAVNPLFNKLQTLKHITT